MQPWYWRSLPLENQTGSEVLAALFLGKPDAKSVTYPALGFAHTEQGYEQVVTLLESPYPTISKNSLSRYSLCAGAPRMLNGVSALWTPPVGEILPFLRRLLQRSGLSDQNSKQQEQHSLPFTGGWLGWLGYDLAWEIERLPRKKPDILSFPVAYWYEPECFAVLDHWEQTLWLAATDQSQLDQLQSDLAAAKEQRSKGTGENLHLHSPLPLHHFLSSQSDYENTVRQAIKYIQAGEIFQANLSLRFECHTHAEAFAIYRRLQQINPSPFASYWQTPWGAVISCSPERLVQLQERLVQTRPIAGTRSRSPNSAFDQQLAQDLISNAKEKAEHIMLVDLERNDLGQVCEWGSVEVNELLTIERYSHVMHLVSNVRGTLRSDCDAIDVIRALFPGGTITGCPKVRCLEVIEELENMRRNLFYGSCGYLDWRGRLDLNILIRTLLFTKTSNGAVVWGQVGAGIVADSDPEKEWNESLHKAQAQLAALSRKGAVLELGGKPDREI